MTLESAGLLIVGTVITHDVWAKVDREEWVETKSCIGDSTRDGKRAEEAVFFNHTLVTTLFEEWRREDDASSSNKRLTFICIEETSGVY